SESQEETACTDKVGAYAIEVPHGKYEIVSFTPRFQFGDERVMVDAAGAEFKRDIVATRQSPLEGIVRAEDGKPVFGASIGLLYELQGMSSLQPTEVVTAADGSFRLYATGIRT